jgi:hypothetical protein
MFMRKRISEKVSEENSRRDFLKTAGFLSLGIAGASVLTNCVSPVSDSSVNKSAVKGDLFKGKPVSYQAD